MLTFIAATLCALHVVAWVTVPSERRREPVASAALDLEAGVA